VTDVAARARNPLAFLEAEIDELKAKGLYRRLRVVESEQKSRCVIDGREVITLSSNNYLGLNTHPRLKQAALDAVERFGAGSGAVRTIAGTMSLHEELETRLATSSTSRPRSPSSRASPATPASSRSWRRRARRSSATRSTTRASSTASGSRRRAPDLPARRHGAPAGRPARDPPADAQRTILVITDGVFSMDGDIAKLPEIVEAAEEAEAIVYVDDAHASGVLGRNGRGSVDHFDLHGRVHVQVGTLSKAIGVLGGYVAGPQTPAHRAGAPGAAVPVLDLAPAGGGGRVPGGHRRARGRAELIERCGRTRATSRPASSGSASTSATGDADHAGDRRRRRPGASVQRPALRGGRLRHGHRLPDRPGGQEPGPDDRHRRAHPRGARHCLEVFERVGRELAII
jgi:hypothetical protein